MATAPQAQNWGRWPRTCRGHPDRRGDYRGDATRQAPHALLFRRALSMKVTRLTTLRAISSVIGFRVRRAANLLDLPVGFRLDLDTGLRRRGHTFGLGASKAIEVELHDLRRRGGLGAGDPSAPRKPNNQGHNGADGYSLQQTSAGLSLHATNNARIGSGSEHSSRAD